MRCERRGDSLATLSVLVACLALLSPQCIHADRAHAGPATGRLEQRQMAGDPDAGRQIFNGKGVCYYCHGLNGDPASRPSLAPSTAEVIARLDPPPADLRRRRSLKLQDDRQRTVIIREGHPGTGMFPDPTMTDQELADLLAFLAQLRQEERSPNH